MWGKKLRIFLKIILKFFVFIFYSRNFFIFNDHIPPLNFHYEDAIQFLENVWFQIWFLMRFLLFKIELKSPFPSLIHNFLEKIILLERRLERKVWLIKRDWPFLLEKYSLSFIFVLLPLPFGGQRSFRRKSRIIKEILKTVNSDDNRLFGNFINNFYN